MRKTILVLFLTSLVFLSGCGSPVKKKTPEQNQNEVTQNEGQKAPENGQSQSNQQANESNTSQAAASDLIMSNGVPTVKNPDDILVLVNKERNLPADWAPDDLTVPNVQFSFKGDSPKKNMREEAARALEELFQEAESEGIKLYAVSGYRSYATQKTLFNNEVKQYGEEAAKKSVAYPGQSEHQTGLCIDVSCESMNGLLSEKFADTKEGKWLNKHAKDFGFIIRYPKDKVDITGYEYEPWHIRYIGKKAAEYVVSNDITFDEYYEKVAKK